MGFYGHITNVQRTSMTFDRIYPNRFTMDERASNDGVYAGRYVLVEYDQPIDKNFLPRFIQFDGLLYMPPPVRQSYNPEDADPTSPTSYLVKLIPYQVNLDIEEDIYNNFVKPDLIGVCSAGDNLGVVYRDDQQTIESVSRLQYFRIGEANNPEKESYNLLYNYKTNKFQLDSASSREPKIGCSYIPVNYENLITEDKSNHLLNFNIDASKYPTSRGYDSTVWQKSYVDGKPKYVMIAELNSVVPILDVTADAPTLAPMMPHFDKDSTNVYYKLHMQPSWGFRVRAASHNLTIPTLDYSGSKITDSTGRPILAGKHKENYPSDEKVTWMNTISDGYDYTNQYLVTDETNVNLGIWKSKSELDKNSEAQIDGAIYYNKAGFNKKISTHSNLLPRVTPIVDEISLTPTGFSGHLYPHHTTEGINEVQPDVNELTVMLPSIGDTVADMWDIIYGTAEINGTHKGDDETGRGTGTYERNTVIRWEDAKKVLAKEGLRLVKAKNGLPGYTYNDEAVNTLAGVINSAQDIIGMIITNDYPININDTATIEKLNDDYIYYDSTTGKYYFKKRDYTYTPVDDNFKYEKVDLKNWEEYKDNTWWVDTNNILKPDYIREDTFRPERKYVQGVKVPGKDDDGEPRKFDAVEYEKGKYYLYTDTVRGTNEPLVDDVTKKPYHEYYLSHEARDVNKQYWKITPTPKTLKSNTTYYVPNKYYAGYFYKAAIADEDDFERQLANGVRLFLREQSSETYGISIIEKELKSGDYPLIGKRPVFYLTLKTYSATEEEYAAFKDGDSEKPILFASNLVKSDGAQNYYVVSRKYELFTDKKTIEASPGVYYKLKQEKAQAEYLEAGNILKAIYIEDLELEQDVIVDEGYLYFREVVELILNTSENVVNIADAEIVYPEALPNDLYQLYTKILDDGSTYRAYKKISAQSSEIVSTKDLGTLKDLYTLKIEELALGYLSETYYYQVTDRKENHYQSVILDNRLESTKDREYWLPEMINKRKMTAEEIKKGKIAGISYYVFDEPNNTYKIYTGTLFEGRTYYINSLIDAPEFYYANKYYYQNENGEFVLDTSDKFTKGREYYKDPQLYIYEDPNKFYDRGAIWPLAQNPPEDSGIILSTRKETWTLEELKGFDVHYNTLHGLILRLNKMMLQGDDETRDEETVQGALNKLTDLIHRFGAMKPGQLMMVDNAGRMQGVTYSTKQDFSAINYGKDGAVKIESTEADANGEDCWIDIDSDDDFRGPSLTIKHNFTKVKDTTTTRNLNTPLKNTVDLYAPIVDNKGHVVGKNIETVTLPFGFKTLTAANSAEATATQANPATNKDIIADNTQDILHLVAGNKWIQLITNDATDTLSIAHRALTEATTVNTSVTMDNGTNETVRNIIGPFVQDIDLDEAGHVTKEHFISYTLPNSYQILKVDDKQITTAQNAHDTLVIQGDEWLTPTISQGLLKYSHNKFDVVIPEVVSKTMDNLTGEDRNTFGPLVSGLEYDAAGHLTKINQVSYKLPNSYQIFTSGDGQVSTAENAYDTFSFAGDSWLKPTVAQGSLTYTHINNNMAEGFVVTGSHTLGAQTPQFGDTFNMQTYTLDDNGHIINKDTETVLIPTDIRGLLLTSFNDENSHYLTTGMTLETALATLDETINEHATTAAETYAPIEGNVTETTTFLYKKAIPETVETLEDGSENIIPEVPEVRKTLQEAINILSTLDSSAIRADQTFIYTPAIEEESHEATQEEVDAGLATAVGEKIIDVEYVPAEELTIQDLFEKVKSLETILNNLTT